MWRLQYLGSHSYHLDRSLLQQHPAAGARPVNNRRPNKNFGGPIRTIANDLIANYESLSVIFRQRMYKGISGQVSYTWSHTLDVNTDSNGGGTPMNPYNWRADYGNSNWDIRHRLVASFVYDIPFFSGANSVLKTVLGNWQANGIITIRGGLPFNVSTGTDTANTASSGTYRPNLVKTPTADCGSGHLVGCIDAQRFHHRRSVSGQPEQLCVWQRRPKHLARTRSRRGQLLARQEFPDPRAGAVPVPIRDLQSVQPRELRKSGGDDQHFDLSEISQVSPRAPTIARSSWARSFLSNDPRRAPISASTSARFRRALTRVSTRQA